VDVCLRHEPVNKVEDLVSVFDLTCCMNVYDGKTLWIFEPTLLFHKRMLRVKKNPKTSGRMIKYRDRGFTDDDYYNWAYLQALSEHCETLPLVL
jgi:hypothetical protein